MSLFDSRKSALEAQHRALLDRANPPVEPGNGIFRRYQYPILTAEHTPLFWRYDYDRNDNPLFLERQGINAVFNAGALLLGDKYLVVCRVEGNDRKSFFAVAQSDDGVNQFRFWDRPIQLPETESPDINVYDMRLIAHQDGYIYGIFCTERKDASAPPGDTSSATAKAGIVRTKDLLTWERLPDLETRSPQQRNVVLHPEFVVGKYLLYTRPQDGFIETGSGGGICWGLTESMCPAKVDTEQLLDPRVYHTIKEVKNGAGAPPLRTPKGWLHIAHGVRNTAAGLRYTLYAFLTDLSDPTRVIAAPAGHLMAPQGEERVGDVSNVLFSNGAIADKDGRVLIYYASSDTRLHVAESSVEQLVDYVTNTPSDGLRSAASVITRTQLIDKNLRLL